MSRKKLENEIWPPSWINGEPSDHTYDFMWNKNNLIKCIEDDDTFHIGPFTKNEAAKTVECVSCGGREFNVGSGHYFTAIRCVKCQWEICFHEG